MRNLSVVRTVGITGGLSSGTSTVANLFRSRGIAVIDASYLTYVQLNRGTDGYRAVVAAFGQGILMGINGLIDRPRLSHMVTYNPYHRNLLYASLAPYIRAAVLVKILELRAEGHRLIVIDAPMLFEVEMQQITDVNVVVWVDPVTQVRRLMERDGITEQDARHRINAQVPLNAKANVADTIMNNNGSLDAMNEQFQRLFLEVSS